MKAAVLLLSVLLTVCFVEAGVVRKYYIAAEEVTWNYAPTGINQRDGLPLDQSPESALFFTQSPASIGGSFIKAQYVQYTDSSFSVEIPKTDDYEHTGILGPIIYAEVGDTIEVHFRNHIRYTTTFHTHGVFASKENEGVYDHLDAENNVPGNHVLPGDTHTYTFPVPARAGPGKKDFSSVVYPYHSYYNFEEDINSGLVGAIVVTRKGYALPNGKPVDVDREFFLLFQVYDEKSSLFFEDNVEAYIPAQVGNAEVLSSFFFTQSMLRRHINGYQFANIPGISMKTGEHVRWYVLALGAERDVHTAHWDGQTLVTVSGVRITGEIVFPAKAIVLDMVPDQVGTFEFSCHVNTHYPTGMLGYYTIEAGDGYNPDRNFATSFDPIDFINNIRDEDQSSNSVLLTCSTLAVLFAAVLVVVM